MQPTQTVTKYEEWSVEQLYQYGTALLKAGRLYERAITVLSLACKREPGNADFQAALGDAYVARFASLTDALHQTENLELEKKNYQWRHEQWAKAQSDPAQPLFALPEPLPPPRPTTRDDSQIFTLPKSETLAKLRTLAREAVAAYDKASEVAENVPERRAQANYHQGWGLFLLLRVGEVSGTVRGAAKEKDTVTRKGEAPEGSPIPVAMEKITSCFTEIGPECPAACGVG